MRDTVFELNLLPPELFGFRAGHSATHQLLRLHNTILNNKRLSKSTAVVMLDFEKAFDNVWHDGLLHKMSIKGLPKFLIKMIRSYLQDRSFRVTLGSTISDSISISAGVPQGSILGPLLFCIFLADIPSLPQGCELFLFADDTAVAVKGRKPHELRFRAQKCVDIIVKYVQAWKLKINQDKTQAIIFPHRMRRSLLSPSGRHRIIILGSTINWSRTAKYLGVIFD